MKQSKSAFTLIELLVVIAIIAILAAILFPVFAQAKEAAKKTQTLSNVKQLNLSNIMYATDHDDNLPFAYMFDHSDNCSFDLSNFQAWTEAVFPYVKSGQNGDSYNASAANNAAIQSMFIDPAWNYSAPPRDSRGTVRANDYPANPPEHTGNFPFNSYLPSLALMGTNIFRNCSWAPADDRIRGSANMTSIARPANTIMITQGYRQTFTYGNSIGASPESCCGLPGDVMDPDWTFKLPQRQGMAYGLADGHARFIKTTDAYYTPDPTFAGNTNSMWGGELPEPFGPIAASWNARPNAQFAFGPRNGGPGN